MPLLSRLARATEDYRALKAGVAIASAASALSSNVAIGQERPVPASAATVAPDKRPIPQKACNLFFDIVADALEKRPSDFITPVAKAGFRNFFIGAAGKVDCTGPDRRLPWANDSDFVFIMSAVQQAGLASQVAGLLVKADFGKEYGVKPAVRPTPQPAGTSQIGSQPAPRG